MSMLFLIFVALVAWHFFYEAILLPSLRLNLRFRMFMLRDELRRLRIESPDHLTEELFQQQHQAINSTITLLPRLDFRTFHFASVAMNSDAELAKRIRKRLELIDSCPLLEYREIHQNHARLVVLAVFLNSGGWFVYVLPLALVIRSLKGIPSFARQLLVVPESELPNILPSELPAT